VRHSAERRAANSRGHIGKPTPDTTGLPAWNRKPTGHRRIGNGHYQVKCADGKWRYEHRLVWEAAHGPLLSSVLIHHVNHDPFDNRLENLIALTRSEHMRHHIEERAGEMQRASVAKRNARKAAGGTY
jgi:hypothetical protein